VELLLAGGVSVAVSVEGNRSVGVVRELIGRNRTVFGVMAGLDRERESLVWSLILSAVERVPVGRRRLEENLGGLVGPVVLLDLRLNLRNFW